MKLTMLGTGNALVSECYNTCFILEDERQLFLVDGGGGNTILHQIRAAGYDLNEIHHIFVTHKHIDHLLGIIWMVRLIAQAMNRGVYEGEAFIYSHGEVLELLRDICGKLLNKKEVTSLEKRLHLVEVKDEETRHIIGHEVTFFDIRSTKAKQFGFRMKLEENRVLTCCGDEPLISELEGYAERADWLLHEAFCLHSQADRFHPYEKHHSTVKDACMTAERLQVRNLVLYHTEENSLEHRKELYGEEGKQYYHGNLWVPDDLEQIEL